MGKQIKTKKKKENLPVRKAKLSLESCINNFIEHIKSISTAEALVMPVVIKDYTKKSKTFVNFLDKHGNTKKEKNIVSFSVPIELASKVDSLRQPLKQTRLVSKMLPKSFVIMLVSQYDNFLGQIISCIYTLRTELLNASDRQLNFTELNDLGSVKKAKEYLLEKEIESLLRKSHSEQFDWLERKFNINLRKELEIWPKFIELTERRNLFVHSNGIVSSQYKIVCKKNNVKGLERIKLGQELGVTKKYFIEAYNCMFELGFKLGQVLWRKTFTTNTDLKNADRNLQHTIYNLLLSEDYGLAIKLSDFACSKPMKYPDDVCKRIHIINKAIAYKWSGKDEICNRILNSEDWSSAKIEFQLAIQVLREEFSKAKATMLEIGKGNKWVTKENYQGWPVFKKFRQSKEFKQAFKKIFGTSQLKVKKPKPLGKQIA